MARNGTISLIGESSGLDAANFRPANTSSCRGLVVPQLGPEPGRDLLDGRQDLGRLDGLPGLDGHLRGRRPDRPDRRPLRPALIARPALRSPDFGLSRPGGPPHPPRLGSGPRRRPLGDLALVVRVVELGDLVGGRRGEFAAAPPAPGRSGRSSSARARETAMCDDVQGSRRAGDTSSPGGRSGPGTPGPARSA